MKCMKLVLITGHSCSGKTTAAKMITKFLPNCVVIHGDSFLRDAIRHYAKEYKQMFGIDAEAGVPGLGLGLPALDVLERNPNVSIAEYRKIMDMYSAFVDGRIQTAIEEIRTQCPDYLVIEYVFLPKFDIWKRADARVLVSNTKEQRAQGITLRDCQRGRGYSEELHNKREAAFGDVVDNATDLDFAILNTYDADYEETVKWLAERIVQFTG
jgi:uridine kinase